MQTRGLMELKSAVAVSLRMHGFDTHVDTDLQDEGIMKLAIIGRPNVGKSSLVNAISGEIRSIVKDMPGTTRDSIDTIIEFRGEDICLIDTAGIRRS